ncbi:MAG: DNA alkylation repair protein [Patescibacteria group bacterium]
MDINQRIRQELRANIEEKHKESSRKIFKEKISCYGVKTPVVRRMAKKHFKQISYLSKKEILVLSEHLLKSGYNEEATIAIQWTGNIVDRLEKKDLAIFEKWLDLYMDNWAKVDDFCLHVIHPLIVEYLELVHKVKQWPRSANKWLRRASAVSFITTVNSFYATRHDLEDIFEVAETLLPDTEDMVQKGYGWMLKSASVQNRRQVFDFIMKHKPEMPRTALRYAIEKMPDDLKKRAMIKD